MSAVEDLANALGMVLGKLAESAEHFNMALVAWEEGSAGLAVLHGTNDVEAQQVLANHGIGRDQLIQAREMLGLCSEQIRNYGSSIGANPAPTTGAIPRSAGSKPDTRARGVELGLAKGIRTLNQRSPATSKHSSSHA